MKISLRSKTEQVTRQLATDMLGRAREAQAGQRFGEAAVLFAEVVRLQPHRTDLLVMAGHMFKESGDLAAAERYYRDAVQAMPSDADLALQLGHFFRSAGRLAEAEAAYSRARELEPGWDVPTAELASLRVAGWLGDAAPREDAGPIPAADAAEPALRMRLATELVPRPLHEIGHGHRQGIELRRIGRQERTYWGKLPTLRGVEAVRGICISEVPILRVALSLNGQLVYRGGVKGGYVLAFERENPRLRKYVFNIWIDLSNLAPGRYEFECRCEGLHGREWSHGEQVVIAEAVAPSLLPESDGVVSPLDPLDGRSPETQINTRPSVARAAGRGLLREPPRAVLVQRPDQLGDLVVSVPALRRLRALFPEALLVGLVSTANQELAATLGLFDELVAIDFPASEAERQRVMTLEAQQALSDRLAPYRFDVAIDLCEAGRSRFLLPLANAPIQVGFRNGEIPDLDVEVEGNTRDKWNSHEIVSHGNKALGLVEWLAAMMYDGPNLARREDLSPGRLAAFGLPAGTRFVVLHAGARARFSRWPHYLELAAMLIEQTDLHVVMMAIDPATAEQLPDTLRSSGRFQLLHQRLSFDDFDALATFCAVFVGDDSGPKHLASLRGAPVVSVQTARNNWIEWGQDSSGWIVTRRVPCAGCLIQSDLEAQECGKDIVCLTAISASDVFAAVGRVIGLER